MNSQQNPHPNKGPITQKPIYQAVVTELRSLLKVDPEGACHAWLHAAGLNQNGYGGIKIMPYPLP